MKESANIKSINSPEVITNKIIAQAHEYEEQLIEKAKADAAEILKGYEEKAKETSEKILSAANAAYEEKTAGAKSSQEMTERSHKLAVKVELIEKAYVAAIEKIKDFSKDEYLSVFVRCLTSALKDYLSGEEKASLSVGIGSPVSASELMEACPEASGRIIPSEKTGDFISGFCLESGDIRIDCSAGALVDAVRSKTENGVVKILFEGE